jgi:Putative zinc-finger
VVFEHYQCSLEALGWLFSSVAFLIIASFIPQPFLAGKRAIAMKKIIFVDSESLEFEQFELLSAYLDGEVSAAERKQVEAWLDQDPNLRRTYQQLLTLQNGLKVMPTAIASMQPEQLAKNVLTCVDRRSRRLWVWGGIGAAAAVAMGSISALLTGPNWDMQTAQNLMQGSPTFTVPSVSTLHSDPNATLMIALERPPVEIPIVPRSELERKQGIVPTSEF